MIYLLDTDSFIILQRGTAIIHANTPRKLSVKQSAAHILAKCKERSAAGDIIGLSAISAAELEFGLHHGGQFDKVEPIFRRLLAPFTIFPFDEDKCVLSYGFVRENLEAKGMGIGPLDTLIAAHALALSAILVTHNTDEFCRVKDLYIEDWY